MVHASVLILGGGFGGLAAAHTLRSLLPAEHKIILIDKSPHFIVGATKTWLMLGTKTAEDVTASRKKILPPDVEFAEAEILSIDKQHGNVKTDRGEFHGDYIIIALGADMSMERIPGLGKAAHSFYTAGDALRLQSELHQFSEGEIVFLIPQIPIKCPPAPYEAAFMLHDYFIRRGNRERISISIYTIEPGPMATAGPEMSAFIQSMIEDRNIDYHPVKQTESVDDKQQKIYFIDGSEKKYDLLIAVPPHKAPKVISDAGLCNESGWIPVDPKTMKVKHGNNHLPVYAAGDNTVVPLPGRYKSDKPLVLPKAGVFAASQGVIAAKHIAASIDGKIVHEEFDGKGFCFIEVGEEKAIKGDGAFYELPHPKMNPGMPDSKQYNDKLQWIENWLKGKIV